MDRESPGNKIKQYRQFPTTKVKNCKKDKITYLQISIVLFL